MLELNRPLPRRDRVLLQVRLEPDLHRALRVAAAERGLTLTELVRAGLERTIDQHHTREVRT